jgi:hypothetical protein
MEGSNTAIIVLRLTGVLMLIIGVVTAYIDMSFGGFSPIFWFILALSAFFGVICNLLFQIKAILQKK